MMHRIPQHAWGHAPCNAYCVGDTHVDVDDVHPGRCRAGQTPEAYLYWKYQRWYSPGTITLLQIRPAPEALPYAERAPVWAALSEREEGLLREEWQPFLLHYRVNAGCERTLLHHGRWIPLPVEMWEGLPHEDRPKPPMRPRRKRCRAH